MNTIFGFEPVLAAAMLAVVIVYYIFAFSPVVFSLIVIIRRWSTLQRKFLFVSAVVTLTYGLWLAFLILLCVPFGAFLIFVLPSLKELGYFKSSWLLAITDFLLEWWWVISPPSLATTALLITKYLAKRWNKIANALQNQNTPTSQRVTANEVEQASHTSCAGLRRYDR